MREGLIISGRLVQGRAQHPSTGPPTYQIIKITNANHKSMMKTNLTTITCSRERFALYKSSPRLVLRYKKDWATLLHFVYFCYLLLVTNYPITKLSVTTYFSTCREYLAGNRLSSISFCSSLGSTLLLIERTTIDPLYLWVIKCYAPNSIVH